MKNQYSILISVLFLMFFKPNYIFGQQPVFNKVTSPDSSSFSFVTGITQDVYGNMWFGTKIGLYCYNGFNWTSFKTNPANTNSIGSTQSESLFADETGNIWIGFLGAGLDHYDREKGIFTHYRHDPSNPASLCNDTVTAILQDKHGIFWIGTHGGLDRFDTKTNTFTHFRHNADDPTSLSNNLVRVLFEDKEGTLWIGTGSPYPSDGGSSEDGGLNRMDKKTGTFTRFMFDVQKSNSLSNNKVSAIFEDNKGLFWVGTAKNGLHKMNREKGTFERIVYNAAHPDELSGPPVRNESEHYEHITFITQDVSGNYWIGSSHAGVNYYNSRERKMVRFSANSNPSAGLTDNGVWEAYNSRDGILWIGCTDPDGKILRISTPRQLIPYYKTSGGNVNSFYQDSDGSLWIGTDRDLVHSDKQIVKQYINSAGHSEFNDNTVHTIKEDLYGNIWIAGGRGLTMWNKKDKKFKTYKNEPGNEKSLSSTRVFSILDDTDTNLWIGSFRGLNLLDRKSGSFTRYIIYPEDADPFGKNFITSIYQDRMGKIWTGNWFGGGVNLLNRVNNQFKTYLKGLNIIRIFNDIDGILWACTETGLYKYDETIDNFSKFYDPVSLFTFAIIRSIIEDEHGNLWLSTPDGIARLNRNRDEIRIFGKNFGVSSQTFSYQAAYQGSDGKLYFGDATGYFKFDPVKLSEILKQPEIVISGFQLAEQAIKPGDDGPLKESLLLLKEIHLRHNQNVFSFDFNIVDYNDPEQNRLYYLLENYETTWHQANSERKAYYFNIPPGKYKFRIKAVNGNGVWAEKQISVIILPPWWKTWWAYGFYALLVIAAVFAFDRLMRRRMVQAERKRTEERELLHAKEIQKAYTELKETQSQLIQSEKMASLGELTAGIAHEIQNPLNFVNIFSEVNSELIDELKAERNKQNRNFDTEDAILNDIQENEQKINHHGRRADAIVKGMLQHSGSNSGVKEPTDINALADEYLRLAYHGLRAKDKSFNATLKTDFDDSIGKIDIIPQEIGRVILNLITNAFYAVDEKKKQNPEGFEPTVTVYSEVVNPPSVGPRWVKLTVKDNGNGIPQKVLDKIFQPFFTTKPAGQGTGLGLSLAYDIVKSHGGILKVETIEGAGSTFEIQLPL